jgi:hypothetical protein
MDTNDGGESRQLTTNEELERLRRQTFGEDDEPRLKKTPVRGKDQGRHG